MFHEQHAIESILRGPNRSSINDRADEVEGATRIKHARREMTNSLRLRTVCRLALGLTSADIGVKLGITERTANYHFTNIISKLGVLNRKEAVAKAVARGFINIEN